MEGDIKAQITKNESSILGVLREVKENVNMVDAVSVRFSICL
jgi:hypothetical protein